MTRARIALALFALGGLLLVGGAAHAFPTGSGPNDAPVPVEAGPPGAALRARMSFDQAREAFARKSYVAAATAFEQSAGYVPHANPWVNAAEAWILAGDPVRAARACDRALAFADLDAAIRAQAVERLKRVEPRIATLEVTGPGSSVRVDGGEPLALPAVLRLAPGSHAISVAIGDATEDWIVELGPGELVRRTAGASVLREAPDTRAAADTVAGADRRRSGLPSPPTLTVVCFGVAAAGVAGAVVFGLSTLDAREHWRDDGARD